MITNKQSSIIIVDRPIIWLVTHPYPEQDNVAWVINEKEQSWQHYEKKGWFDVYGNYVGLPKKPWPVEIQNWIEEGISPVLFPINDFKYVSEKYSEWWKELHKNDILRSWILGWNPITDINLKKTWKGLNLEYKLMLLETSISLKNKVQLCPIKQRFTHLSNETLQIAESEQNKLLVNVIKLLIKEWENNPSQ